MKCNKCGKEMSFENTTGRGFDIGLCEECEWEKPADLPEAGASSERISSVVRSADKTRLIKLSAELLTTVQLSDCGEDYKFKMPKYILRQIEKQSNRLREIAIELKEMSDRIK